MTAGIPEAQAIDIVTGLTQAKADQLEQIIKQPQFFNTFVSPLMQEGKSLTEAIEEASGIKFIETAQDIVNQQGVTAPTLTTTTLQGIEKSKDGGRVGFQEGGEAISEAVVDRTMQPTGINAASPSISPMSFDELREKLPDYISDDVVKLLAENPMALMELAQAQTDRDLRAFEKKYKVDVTMPQAESEVDYTGAV